MVLQLLLARKDEDPTARQNEAIISASAHMRHEVVKLLSHPSVKPSQSENKALVAAAGAGKKRLTCSVHWKSLGHSLYKQTFQHNTNFNSNKLTHLK
jgi:hypothetical protein